MSSCCWQGFNNKRTYLNSLLITLINPKMQAPARRIYNPFNTIWHSDWCKESQAGVLAATNTSNRWDTWSSSNRGEDCRQRCSWGAAMATPVVPSHGTPPEKWNKLSVKRQTKGRFVVAAGFELARFLGEDFRGSRTYSGSLWHIKYFWEIDKKYISLLLNFSFFLNDASIAPK